jgi:hypothetical protein
MGPAGLRTNEARVLSTAGKARIRAPRRELDVIRRALRW